MNRRRELSQERIYLKAEPSGEIAIASLSKQDLVAVSRDGLSDDARFSTCKKLLSQKKRAARARGLFNNGNDGDKGNLGVIRLLSRPTLMAPHRRGFTQSYFVLLALSKVSIEFNCPLPDGEAFDPSHLVEECVPISLPRCVEDDTYGRLSGNVCTGYRYKGKSIKNWGENWVDRGVDEQLLVVQSGPVGDRLIFKLSGNG